MIGILDILGHMKVFHGCGELLILLRDSVVCARPFFFLHHSIIFLLLMEAVKGIKDLRKKTRILFDSNFILGIYDNSVLRNVFLNQ